MPLTGSPPARRLPPGRHGLPRHFVIHSQRERLLRGVAEAAAQEGYARMTLAHIVQRAGVSRRTFYELFSDKDAAMLAAYEAAIEQLVNVIVDALATTSDWRGRLRRAADALLAFLAAEPSFTRMVFVEAPTANPPIRARHRETLATFEAALADLRPPEADEPPPLVMRAIVGGIQQLLVDAVVEDRIRELPRLRPTMMYLVLLPWLGEDEARRELEQPSRAQAELASAVASAASRASASDA
jgi:AcrR family transcriptional regulator